MTEYFKLYDRNPNQKVLSRIAEILKGGGIVIYPTDTVYAMGCDIRSLKAIERLARLKGTEPEKAEFSILCRNLSHLSEYTKPIPNEVFRLMKRCFPGPYTFILPTGGNSPKILNSKRKTVGIRVPDNPITQAIIEFLDSPLVSTSLKDEDQIIEYTTNPELMLEKYDGQVEAVVDGGYGNNIPSTVIDCSGDEPFVVRQGLGEIDLA